MISQVLQKRCQRPPSLTGLVDTWVCLNIGQNRIVEGFKLRFSPQAVGHNEHFYISKCVESNVQKKMYLSCLQQKEKREGTGNRLQTKGVNSGVSKQSRARCTPDCSSLVELQEYCPCFIMWNNYQRNMGHNVDMKRMLFRNRLK